MATAAATPSKLADIIKYRRQQGGGVAGSLAGGIKEKFKEKFDPRQIFNQQGILTALFPGLKAFKATTGPKQELKDKVAPSISFDEIVPVLNKININTRILSKNMMVLPAMHRDINVMRQNIGKLVKLRGASATTKADMYFMKAKERESLYEEQYKRVPTKPTKIPDAGTESKDEEGPGLISKVLGGIVGAISSLGNAILSVFTTLGSILKGLFFGLIVPVVTAVLSALGSVLGTLILEFIKGLGIFSSLGKFLRFLVTRILPRLFWPLAIAAAAYYINDKFNIFGGLYESMAEGRIQDAVDTLPMPNIKVGEEVSPGQFATKEILARPGKPRDFKNVSALNDSGPEKMYNPTVAKEVRDGKKQAYNLVFPGLTGQRSRLSLPLTENEALDFGRKYATLNSTLQQLDALRKKKKESKSPADERKYQKDIDDKNFVLAELLEYIRKKYKDVVQNSFHPEILNNTRGLSSIGTAFGGVKGLIDDMERLIQNPELQASSLIIPKEFQEAFDFGTFDEESLNRAGAAAAEKVAPKLKENVEGALSNIRVDPNQFTPQLTPSGDKDGSGTQIQQKTGEVKDNKQGALTPQTDTKVSSLSSQQQTSSVSHVGETASPWNVDLIENLLTGGRNVMVG